VWHRLLIHAQWSTGDDGLVEVWHSQGNSPFSVTPQVSAPGPNVLTVAGDVLPVFAETGIYRSQSAATQIVYYAGLTAEATQVDALRSFARQTSTAVSCFPTSTEVGVPATCSITVTDTDTGTPSDPTGTVQLSTSPVSSAPGSDTSCLLGQTSTTDSSSCTVSYTPAADTLQSEAESDLLSATYAGDDDHTASDAPSASLRVTAAPQDPILASVAPTRSTPPPAAPSRPPAVHAPTKGASGTSSATYRRTTAVGRSSASLAPAAAAVIVEHFASVLRSHAAVPRVHLSCMTSLQLWRLTITQGPMTHAGKEGPVLAQGRCTGPSSARPYLVLRLTERGRNLRSRIMRGGGRRRLSVTLTVYVRGQAAPARRLARLPAS
jgi:hypothetical protein